ncbi:MAG: hypothetical protein GX227_04130 [Clostridiaceae bacterium]|jgi:hypothetical protein|nr:hypothetical protein [Clostridiaceae bacterium]
MNVVFLGKSTEEKKFLLLCLAKIMSCHKKAVLISKSPFSYENVSGTYDYCGIEIIRCENDENLLSKIIIDAYNFLDVDELINVPEGFIVVAVSEPTRRMLEECTKLASEYTWFQPSLSVILIFLNVMEYCKIGERYLDLFWERSLPSFTQITHTHTIYFEESNRRVMIESQFINKLHLKLLSPALKSTLKAIIQDIFSLEKQEVKAIFKKAERV